MSTISGHTTRAVGTVLTAAIYNFDHVNHVNNANALNADKMEGATPPVVDGEGVVWDGTGGNALRSLGYTPYGPGVGVVPIAQGGTGQTTAALGFGALKQAATNASSGAIEHATDAEVRATSAGNFAVTPALIRSAATLVTITDAATIAWDWDAGINFQVTMAGNRTLGLPSNPRFGTWRTIWVQGNDGTARTLSFAAGYLGPSAAALTPINSSSSRFIITIFALNDANAFIIGAKMGPF